MRMLMHVDLPPEPFNAMVRDGSVAETIQSILADIQPEAAYFSTMGNGHRGGILVVDVEEAHEIPSLAEPFFLKFNAQVDFRVAMGPEDLGRSGLDELGRKWG